MKKNKLPSELLPDEKVKLIIKAINDSIPQYMDHVIKEKLPTQNGKYHEIWNYIFKDIKRYFDDLPYKCYKISRGNLWEFIAIFNEENNILYVLMKEETFKKIKKDKDKDYHYIKVLNTINNNISTEKIEQLTLFPEDKDKESYIQDDLERMLGDITKKVKVCVDILFSEKQNKVITMSGNIFNYDLDLIKSYNLDKYIKADIDEIADTKDEYNVENPPIELIIKKSSNNSVDRKHEKEDTEDMVASKEKQKSKLEKK